jgi:hypothetical protein
VIEPAGSQSKVPAPAKTGAGRFKWLRLRNVLISGSLVSTGVLMVEAHGSGLEVAAARETPEVVPAYRDGPPLGFSGGFGEDHCQACHSDYKVNAGPGSLTISAPARYSPGQTYAVTITLKRPRMAMGGFMFTARFEGDSAQAGTLAFADPAKDRVKVVNDRGVQYAHHLRPGTQLTATDVVRWTLRWTAPADKRAILFHAAANAANGDDSQSGDWVYTARVRSRSR